MGNYSDLEIEFIERTLALIDQYYTVLDQYPFEHQYNYTLTINCLLGLIVMPKERVITYIPKHPLGNSLMAEMGLKESVFGPHINDLKSLIKSLRHSIAHFNITILSESEDNFVDWIEFQDAEHGNRVVAKFRACELLPFLRYYSNCLVDNLRRYRN